MEKDTNSEIWRLRAITAEEELRLAGKRLNRINEEASEILEEIEGFKREQKRRMTAGCFILGSALVLGMFVGAMIW